MQNDRVRLNCRGSSPVLPCWTKQDQWRFAAIHVGGNGTATRTTDNHIRVMLIVFSFGDANGLFEVFVGKSGVQNFVAVVIEEGRFLAARNAGPAVEEKDFHFLSGGSMHGPW